MRNKFLKTEVDILMSLSYIGLTLLIGIVLINTNYEISVQNKFFIFSSYLLLCIAILLSVSIKKKLRLSIIDVLVALLCALIFLNYKFITHVNVEFKYLNLFFIGIVYLSLRVIFAYFERFINFSIAIIVFCGFIEAILGIFQLTEIIPSNHALYRVTGTFFNPGPYGGYLSVLLAITIAYIVRYNSFFKLFIYKYGMNILEWPKHSIIIIYILCYFAFIPSFIIFFAVMSRAAILALTISLLIMAVTERSIKNKLKFLYRDKTKFFAVLSLLFIVVISIFYYLYLIKKSSADGRIFMWKIANVIIKDHPFTGVGLGAYCNEYAKVQADYFISNPNSTFINVAGAPEFGFNEYLHIGAEFGVVVMFLFISILMISLYRLFKLKNILSYGLTSIFIFSFFSYPLSILPIQVLLVIFIASAASSSNTIKWPVVKKYTIFIMYLMVLVISLHYGEMYICKINATTRWKVIQHIYKAKHYERVVKEYREIYPYLKDNPRFLFEYGHVLNKIGQYGISILILNEGSTLSSDPMFFNILGNNYKMLGSFDKAENNYFFHITFYQIEFIRCIY